MTNPVGAQVWSQTAANNATIDGSINWAEGMAPSQVNDSARAEMASVAKFISDNNGSLVTAGSSIAYTVTTNQVESALTAGYTVAVQFHVTPDSSATIAVDGLAAKPLQIVSGINLKGGEYLAGSIARFTYSTTGTGQWIANSAEVAIPGTTSGGSANAGLIGEYVTSIVTTGSAVAMSGGIAVNITSIALTAGDWDIFGSVWVSTSASGSNLVNFAAAISNASGETTATGATVPSDAFDYQHINVGEVANRGAGVALGITGLHAHSISASSQTIYLNARTGSGSDSLLGFGILRARRMR